jgi:hypothetical protein
MSPEEEEEFDKLTSSQKIAFVNQEAKDRGRYYENGGIFKSNEMLGVFNVASNAMADSEE